MIRLQIDPRTKEYAARRKAEGKTPRDIIRCLKRFIAREIYRILTDPQPVTPIDDLRPKRLAHGTRHQSQPRIRPKIPGLARPPRHPDRGLTSIGASKLGIRPIDVLV